MATFVELRERFSDDVQKRGKQFERVCKWFLETDPRYSDRLVKVWLWDDWPGRWGPDCGIDLVAEDRDGKNWAIQAKCYDPKYSVTKNDVDKFLSESTNENIHHRLLIATTDYLGNNARGVIHRADKVIPVSQLLLEELGAAPVVWPSNPDRPKGGGPSKPTKRWPHQTLAINNVTRNLGKRGQMISACGTGKTLAALWISESLEAKRTLVLLPSLTLLSQTVSEWLANAKEPFAYLPVCSDDTVSRGNDAAVMFTSDLEYPVTTNPDDIATFLRHRGRQVVFSTYQSSPQIAEAQTLGRVPGFDLVIADEAHRCAGKVSSAYGTVLDDEAIRAKKRLFMTATPRTYTARVQKKADDEGIEVASMDDEAVFGPVVHQLNFGEAIEKGLLTDYQVVVVGVNEDRVKQMVDQRRIIKTDKDIQTDAKTLAKHVALAKAIRDYGLRRTITFHSRINTASAFANLLPKVVSWMPPRHQPKVELVTDHVSGEMTTGERNRRLNWLRNVETRQSAVLTNAQCLSEGIDVPTLDGVAFIDPRRSQVDIVQAVGRAIRRAEDKTIGTIVIPVFLSDTDDPDTALNESEFEPVWSIVRALRSHDQALGEALDGIRVGMGRRGGGGGLPPKIILDVPKGVSADFVDAFETRLVEGTTAGWLMGFGALERFVEREGHSRVGQQHIETIEGKSLRLGMWVHQRRQDYRKGIVSTKRVGLLEALPGWIWDPHEVDFQTAVAALKEIYSTQGHVRALRDLRIELTGGKQLRLESWAEHVRGDYRNGQLSPERVAALEAVPGWVWDPHEEDFQQGLRALKQFVEREGHARVVVTHVEVYDGDEFRLGQWVSVRRSTGTGGRLSPERTAALEAIPGWVWNAGEAKYQQSFRALKQFVEREGHARVNPRHLEQFENEAVRLGQWVTLRREQYKSRRISPERVAALEAVPGWVWDPYEEDFQQGLRALKQFVEREGHARVPVSHVEVYDGDEFRLGQWVNTQRTPRSRSVLPERTAALEAVPGWVWDAWEDQYQRGLCALKQFVEREGHARPLQGHVEVFEGEEINLANWVTNLRSSYWKAKLAAERVPVLEGLPGWVWDANEADFHRRLGALKQFVEREGHARVVRGSVEVFEGEEINLANWVTNLRSSYWKAKLAAETVAVLEALPGWVWDVYEADFQRGLGALKQFVEREGHARPLQGHVEVFEGEEINLGSWVSSRRGAHQKGKLTAEKVAVLEALPGWVWSTR